jgi:hypothetical protein
MKSTLTFFVLAGAVIFAFPIAHALAQTEPADPAPLFDATGAEPIPMDESASDGDCCGCDDTSIFVRRRAVCSECGERHGIGNGRIRGAFAGANGSVAAMMHSGQPLIDPAMRADWIAQQRAAQQSWHAGYYHTEWGAPVALMVAPTVRTHTRWSWGVAQTNVMPLYHQFERPYPGPVMGAEYGGPASPLLPTPRWPSHTDQFGVYPIRGPW